MTFFRKNSQTVRYGLGLQIIPAIGVKNFWADTVGFDMSPTMKATKKKWNLHLVGYNYIDMKKGQQFCDVDKELYIYWYMNKGVLSSEVSDLIWVYVQMPFGLLAFVTIWKVIFFYHLSMKTYLDEFDSNFPLRFLSTSKVLSPPKKRAAPRRR